MKKTILSVRLQLFGKTLDLGMYGRCYNGVSNPEEHYWEIGVGNVTCSTLAFIINESNLVVDKQWMDGVDQYYMCSKRT